MKRLKYLLLAIPLFAIASWEMDFDEDFARASSGSSYTNGVLHPLMTSNTNPSPYFVVANKEYSPPTLFAWYAFDGSTDTLWDNFSTAPTNGWIYIDLTAPKISEGFTFQRYKGFSSYMPKAWYFQGGSDTNAWTDLSYHSGWVTANWPSNAVSFTVTNSTAFRYYRFKIQEVNSANEVGIGEIKILGRIYK